MSLAVSLGSRGSQRFSWVSCGRASRHREDCALASPACVALFESPQLRAILHEPPRVGNRVTSALWIPAGVTSASGTPDGLVGTEHHRSYGRYTFIDEIELFIVESVTGENRIVRPSTTE